MTIQITNHGRPVAQLTPVGGQRQGRANLIASGELQPGRGNVLGVERSSSERLAHHRRATRRPARRPVIYADTSALAKLLIAEAETPALRGWISRQKVRLVTNSVGVVELRRLAARISQEVVGRPPCCSVGSTGWF